MSEISKLKWRCRRGMRELDKLMCTWLNEHYMHADTQTRELFSELLDEQDPDIVMLLNGKHSPAKERHYETILVQLRAATKA